LSRRTIRARESLTDPVSCDQFRTSNCTNDGAGKVIFPFRVESRHLSGFPSKKGTTRLPTGLGDTFNDFLNDTRLQFPGGQIIHKEKRPCPLDQNVVNTVIHNILAHCSVAIESESQFEFRTDTVDTGDQNRVIGQVRKGKEPPRTEGPWVDFTADEMRFFASSAADISTPASEYRVSFIFSSNL
jgi:hypothetical protein